MKPESYSSPKHTHSKADYVGVAGSVLCLVHCLVTPALALGTSFSVPHQSSVGFLGLDFFFIFVNGAAVYLATRDHRIPALRAFLWVSFAIFSVSLLLEHQNDTFQLLGYLGSGLLIAGHVYNLIYCRPWVGRQG